MKIKNQQELQAAIFSLEEKEAVLKLTIKQDVHAIVEELRPSHLWKQFTNTVKDSDVLSPVVDTSIGLAAGVLAKKAITGKSKNVIRNVAGNLAEVGITNFISSHPAIIKKPLSFLFNKIFRSKKSEADNT